MIKAIIFDLDGTLVDSRDIVLGAFQHVLEEFGGEYNEELVSSYVGGRLENTYKVLLPKHDTTKLTDSHRNWQADNRHLLKSFLGLEKFLIALKTSELKLGLFTSATRTRTDSALDILKIRSYFNDIVCAEDVKAPKPDKEGVIRLAKNLKVAIHETVLVGDAGFDILSGKNAGVTTVGITHGFGTKESLEKAGADYLVNNIKELQKLLLNLSK